MRDLSWYSIYIVSCPKYNSRQVRATAAQLERCGYTVSFPSSRREADAERRTRNLLRCSSGLCLLPGWESSEDACAEVAHGLDAYLPVQAVPYWVTASRCVG